jgi:ParB-like chromosome segregation protein Spo0J
MKPFVDDPICSIEWLPAAELSANAWNPNVVFKLELKLLETSILRTGWVQPILISRAGTIIDGFHRWRLAQESKAIVKRYGGKVPCARLQIGEAEAMMLTVRINRAKGSHVAVRMAELVKQLVDEHGLLPQEIAVGIGASSGEVDLLYQDSIFKARNLADAPFSKAWYPAESGKAEKVAG